MNLTFAKTVDALTPVINDLIVNRMARSAKHIEGNADGRLEFVVRRVLATVLGLEYTDLGLAIDDVIFEINQRIGEGAPRMTDVEKAHFVVRAYRRWNAKTTDEMYAETETA